MFSGSGVGGMIIPLFLNYIIEAFGLHGALIILSGLALQTTVFSALYRPLEYWKRKESYPENEQVQIQMNDTHSPKSALNQRRFSTTAIGHSNPNHLHPRESVSRLNILSNDHPRLNKAESKITLYFSAMNLASWLSVPDIHHAVISLRDNSTQTHDMDLPEQKRSSRWRTILRRSCYVKAADGSDMPLFDFRLLKDTRFVLFTMSCMFMLTSAYIGMVIPPYCHDLEISKTEVAWLLSIQGEIFILQN